MSIKVALFGSALAAGTLGAARVPTQASAKPPGPLLPLTYQDEQASQETGCTFTFSSGRHDYLQLVGSELLLRDAHGLRACRLTTAATEDLENGRGAVSCSGYRLRMRPFGRTTSNAATDSSSRRAVLTADRDGAAVRMDGVWGVAC